MKNTMRIRNVAAQTLYISALLFVTSTTACASKTLLAQIPLIWRPTEPITVPPPSTRPSATVGIRPLLDRRANTERIAENLEDANEGKILPVTTRDEVGAWSTAQLSDLMTQSGYSIVNDAGADLFLSGEVVQFFVTETDSYKAEVELRLTLTDASGNIVWTGVGTSHSERSGRSYKAENYYEVLSDAFLEAVQGLLADPKFQTVLAAHAGSR